MGLALLMAGLAHSQGRYVIRDAEIERSLTELAAPILKAADIQEGSIRMIVIGDRTLNAFVTDGKHVFINSGLIAKMERVEMLQSIIAHEIAHIKAGHLTRRRLNWNNAVRASNIGLAFAIATAIISDNPDAGIAIATGSSSVALRNFLSHTRAEESAADKLGVEYMSRAGIHPEAAVDAMGVFAGQEFLTEASQDPYLRTHPLSASRLRDLNALVDAFSGKVKQTSGRDKYWYDRLVAKLTAFTMSPNRIFRKYPPGDNSEFALMSRAVAHHRIPSIDEAIRNINLLLRKKPNDPFYNELKGQILLENGKVAESIAAYERAVRLAPGEPLILAGFGRALLASGTPKNNRRALWILKRARDKDSGDVNMLRDLAIAYSKNGELAMASVATSERFVLMGRFRDSITHAQRAIAGLPEGSPGWLRAQDVALLAKASLPRIAPRRAPRRP